MLNRFLSKGVWNKEEDAMAERECKAAVLEGPYKMSIKTLKIPALGPEDGLLRVEMAGVCGTDPKIYHGKVKVKFPIIPGHEILGYIEEIGEVAAKRYKVNKGDRVIMEAFARCGYCHQCVTGNARFCEDGKIYGFSVSCDTPPYLWGGYAEYVYIAPGSSLHKVSKELPAEAAVLTSAIMSDGIQWGRYHGQISISQTVVINGCGQQGLVATITAKESGANPIIVTGLGVDKERLALAKELGADYTINVEEEDVVERVKEITDGRMADVVIEVTGDPKSVQTSLDLVKIRGTIVNAGLTGTETETPLLLDKITFKEIRFQGVLGSSEEANIAALKLIESRKYPIEKIITHKFPLDKAEEAVRASGGDIEGVYPIKSVIVPS